MNRWVLLKHEITRSSSFEIHYDLLIENCEDCLTWKFFTIPKINGDPVKIIQQNNHRLIWLSRESQELSRGRGYVKRIDYGTYKSFEKEMKLDRFSIILNGQKIVGLLIKKDNFCKLISSN